LASAADWRSLELPAFKGEPGWEFTGLKGFDLGDFETAEGGDLTAAAAAETGAVFYRLPADAVRLTQVDHGWSPVEEAVSEGPLVMPLSQAVEQHGELVDRYLGGVVDVSENVFTARNAAEWAGGAFVYVPRGVKVEAPIVLTAVQATERTALNWRVLVVLEEGAEAEVWEQYEGTQPGLFTTVVELVVGENANLRFISAQGLPEQSWIFGTQRAKVARDGKLDWVVLGFGAGNGKVFQNTVLEGEGAEGKVTGAYALTGRQHLDFDTTQEHAAAHCVSARAPSRPTPSRSPGTCC
jgi:Fe-S cluster assembly protein SufD